MNRDEDPEVAADLALRESSESDTARARSPLSALGTEWRKPADVAVWPCRYPKCAKPVGVTKDTVDALATANGWLAKRRAEVKQLRGVGEDAKADAIEKSGVREIPTSAVVLCDGCRAGLAKFEADRNADRKVAIQNAIARLKASTSPTREHDAVDALRKAGHPEPDVVALLRYLCERLNAHPGKGRRGDL